MTLITEDYAYGNDGLRALNQAQHEEIRKMLLGHRIAKVSDDHIMLDDGTMVRVVANTGGCICGAGDYSLRSLNGVDNVITRVDFETETEKDGSDWGYEGEKVYKVFVVAEDKRFTLLEVAGNDGNGYYGTGYELLIRVP